jgi:hypothetical protein
MFVRVLALKSKMTKILTKEKQEKKVSIERKITRLDEQNLITRQIKLFKYLMF